MEDNVCETDNLILNESENTNLNEAIPAVTPVQTADSPKDLSSAIPEAAECDNAISSTTPDKYVEQLETDPNTSSMMSLEESGLNSESDADFFAAELSISDVPTEKITENVEDIVQDLENLLGESNDSYRFGRSFVNSRSAEPFDEINSSNVDDAQETNLFKVQESNVEDMNLDSLSPKCDILPDDSTITSASVIESELTASVSLDVPAVAEAATDVSPVEVITESIDVKIEESIAVMDFVENTEKVNEIVSVDIELKQELVSVDIIETSKPSVNTDAVIVTDETDKTEVTAVCANNLNEFNPEVATEISSIVEEADIPLAADIPEAAEEITDVPKEIDKTENIAEVETEEINKIPEVPVETKDNQESKIEESEENTTVATNVCDSDEVTTIVDEEIQVPSSLDEAPVTCEQSEDSAMEIIQESVGDSSVVTADDDVDVTDKEKVTEAVDKENVLVESEVKPQNEDVVTDIKQDDLEPPISEVTEITSEITEEEKPDEISEQSESLNMEQCVDRQVIVLSDTEESFDQEKITPQNKLEADIPMDVSAEQDKSSTPEQSFHGLIEEQSTRSTDLGQPLTVEVEDSDINSELTKVSTNEQLSETYKVDKNTDVEIIEAQPSDVPVNKAPVEVEESHRAPIKMTISKHKSDNVHSILKIYDPSEVPSTQEQQIPKLIIKSTPSSSDYRQEEATSSDEPVIPKITIKPVLTPLESQHSPRLTIKPIKPPVSAQEDSSSRSPVKSIASSTGSPRITIKPIIKPEALSPLKLTLRPFPKLEDVPNSPKLNIKPIVKPTEEIPVELHHSPKITIKPIVKPPEEIQSYTEERHSPKITIKPIAKPPEEMQSYIEERHSPKITIKPIVKPPEEIQSYTEERHSPRITIKPILKPEEYVKNEHENVHTPRITIKPIIKPPEEPEQDDDIQIVQQPFKLNIKPVVRPAESSLSPKITIKPVQKPPEDSELIELIDFEEQIKQERIVLKIAKNIKKEKSLENEKLKKIKVKLSKEGGTAHIVPVPSTKRSSSEIDELETKHFKAEMTSDLTISLVPSTVTTSSTSDLTVTRVDSISTLKVADSADSSPTAPVSIEAIPSSTTASSSFNMEDLPDPLADIPVFEITLETAASMNNAPTKSMTVAAAAVANAPPAPRKRGRPRKVPLEVREEFKDPKEEEAPPPVVEESTRPKRSCRGASVRATLGIKPRKPRAPSTRGRGGKRNVSTRTTPARKTKEPKSGKTKQARESMVKESEFKEFESKDVEFKQVPLPGESANREVVIYEEETRMSAENSSRAQTPAKQVLTSTEVIEESQSSIQSNTTTESGEKIQKVRKGSRLEIHQEPEGEVISADKLAEYSWGGGGPYMLQEQVAQFLGIKSFKRKYPGIQRRPVDMQERDFIRESCLASEAMCDMGLTAVKSEDILDIMYTDFQHKYEEYCKHQRDRQAKDVSNKQKALSLAASQEKTKLDIVEQAVQSAFQWNANFNKTRREQRRACMDLQTFTVHFPKGKMKQVNKPPMGSYPLALVPGQFTDYYKRYNPFELNNLPLNTMGCKTVSVNHDTEESQSDASGSDSESSSSDSDSSCSGSSGAEDCKVCRPTVPSSKKVLVN